MKHLKNKLNDFLKKYLGETLIVIGSYTSIANIFAFRWSSPNRRSNSTTGFYHYSFDTQMLIAVGVAMILVGIFILRNRRTQ